MMYLGKGDACFSHVYVGNVVEAHLLAALALNPNSSTGGQAYFIVDHEASNFYDFFTPYLTALGLPVPRTRMPAVLAHGLAVSMESLARMGIGPQPPLLTRYVVLSTCRDFFFNSAKAQRDFGYMPVVSREQAFDETLRWLQSVHV